MRIIITLIRMNKGSNSSFLIAYLVGFMNMIALMIPARILKMIIDIIKSGDSDMLKDVILYACLGTVFSICFIYSKKLTLTRAINSSEQNIQLKLLEHLFAMKKNIFQNWNSGEILTRLTENTPQAVNIGFTCLYDLTTGPMGLILILSYMYFLNPTLMIALVIYNIITIGITTLKGKKLKKIGAKRVELYDKGNNQLMDLLKNSMTIRLSQNSDFFSNLFTSKESDISKINLKALASYHITNEFIWFMKKIAEIALLFGLGGWLAQNGRIDISVIASYTLLSDVFTKVLKLTVNSILNLNKAAPHINAIEKFLEEEIEETSLDIPQIEFSGGIRFENVCFSYKDKVIFNNLNFSIEAGDKTMITGGNGQGKSTLLNLISGLYRPSEGEIYYDDIPGSILSAKQIASMLAYIPQEPQIIKEDYSINIALNTKRDVEHTKKIMKDLSLTHRIENEPSTYSRGEKQRLTIGRALYRESKVPFILGDEIFANIDPENRERIINMLSDVFKDKTVVLVCHERNSFPFNKELKLNNCMIEEMPMEVRV